MTNTTSSRERETISELDVEVRARALFQARWPGKSWYGIDANRSYWRRKAREALATPPQDTPSNRKADQ